MHVKSQAQTSPVFSGLAIRQSDNIWRYSIDTATLPNGKYQVVAKYKRLDSVILSYVGPSFEVSYEVPPSEIGKPVTTTPIQESVELIDQIVKEVQTEIQKPPVPVPYQLTVNQAPSVASGGEEKTINFDDQDLIDTAINQYTAALRSNDPDAIKKAKNRALSLGVELAFDENGGKFPGNNSDITDYLEDLIGRAERIEAMVKERTENKISQDTDNDGITDYDEVTLYKTNPMQPDSDADGFNDGAEILAGFNPLNSETESAVIFESPKEAGITRADILSVDSIVAISESTPKEDGVSAQAEISGRGLPNSFVTLFIYSTPVVVTLKTEDDGSWVYTFDKELEDGEHEVYVGVTDNAGVIVAKSNPFRFIKEAQAFTPADELTDSFAQEPTPRGVDGTLWQAAIFGLIVFIVGLILILLGKQLEHSKQANIANES